MNQRKVKLGLVGCGGMMYSHCLSMLEAGNIEITAVCDIKIENARKTAEQLGLDKTYFTNDYRTMIGKCEAVLLPLPHQIHYEAAVFFARHKVHVLVEKTMCNSEAECRRLIKICEEENVVLMCAYPVPYRPAVLKLKEMVDSGEYGKVIMMSSWTEQNTPVEPQSWAASSECGGGQFWNHGCHYVDVLMRFLGNPVRGTHIGNRVGHTNQMLKESSSYVTMEFENGAIGFHTATWCARGTRLGWVLDIITEKGTIHYDREDGEILFYGNQKQRDPIEGGDKSYEVVWKENAGMSKQTHFEIRHFANCILNGTKPMTDGYSTMQGLRVIRALYDAEEHGTVADLRGLGFAE